MKFRLYDLDTERSIGVREASSPAAAVDKYLLDFPTPLLIRRVLAVEIAPDDGYQHAFGAFEVSPPRAAQATPIDL
jgi:hypothetical protein